MQEFHWSRLKPLITTRVTQERGNRKNNEGGEPVLTLNWCELRIALEQQKDLNISGDNAFARLVESNIEAALQFAELINFDTTALIALVSGISNGRADKLFAALESELRMRFKCNYEFVIAQAMSELQNPMLEELRSVISDKIGIVCESVVHEFKELVAMYGGPNERSRADQLLKNLVRSLVYSYTDCQC